MVLNCFSISMHAFVLDELSNYLIRFCEIVLIVDVELQISVASMLICVLSVCINCMCYNCILNVARLLCDVDVRERFCILHRVEAVKKLLITCINFLLNLGFMDQSEL